MEATIDQFLSVLRFNHYYILDRLRERCSESQFRDLLKAILHKHEEQLSQQYEMLCMVTVETESGLVFTYETLTNIKAGKVHLYQNQEIVRSFMMNQIKEIRELALYHKAMPFEDIIALTKEKKSPQPKKYHNKNFDRLIEVSQAEITPTTTPGPTPIPKPSSIFNTPKKKVFDERALMQNNTGKQSTGISRKLMLISDSESEEHQHHDQQANLLENDKKVRENIIIQKLRQNQYGRASQNAQPYIQRTEKKTNHEEYVPQIPPHQTTSKKTRKLQQTEAKMQQRKREMERQSQFMANWLKKVRIQEHP